MLYKDSTQPIEVRVHDLISRMTLEEKAAQLSCAMPMDLETLRENLKNGIGTLSFLNASMSGDTEKDMANLREIQRFLMEQTRLGIPALIHNEGIAGLQIPGATTFQQPMGMAATWEPALAEKWGNWKGISFWLSVCTRCTPLCLIWEGIPGGAASARPTGKIPIWRRRWEAPM